LHGIEDFADLDDAEEELYFSHSDHLGSSSWITDASGAVNQHLQYLPYGEDFIYQRNSSWNIPYTFSGKERDSETGYSYFGARYYDSDLNVWLSVDPIIKPNESPYLYCAGNPVILIDPNGEDWFKTKDGNYKYDKNINKDSKLEEGETYLGKSYKINVNNKDGEKQYSYSLNEDGSVTDSRGKNMESGFGTYDPKLKSGAKIISEESNTSNYQTPDNNRGTIISAANGIAALGPVGGMFDIGGGVDSYGESRMYFTIGWAQGYGASAGMGFGKTNKNFRFGDMEGLSSGWQGNLLFFSGEYFSDMEKTGTGTKYGGNMSYRGGGIGPGFGGFHYFSTTITAPVLTGEQLFNMVRHWH